jgi:hypothetical protein
MGSKMKLGAFDCAQFFTERCGAEVRIFIRTKGGETVNAWNVSGDGELYLKVSVDSHGEIYLEAESE